MDSKSYEDVIRARLDAQRGETSDETSRRLAESHHDAQRRGVAHTPFALALFALACADIMRSRAKRFHDTILEVKVADGEDPDHVERILKQLARRQFTHGDTFPEIDQFVGRGQAGPQESPSLKPQVEAQRAMLRATGDRLIKDLDSRIDALVYSLKSSEERSRSAHSPDRLAERKERTQERRAKWQREYKKLRRKHPHEKDTWIADQIARMPIAERRSAETIRKYMKG